MVILSDLGAVLWSNRLGDTFLDGLRGESPRERNIVWRWFTEP